MCEQNGNVHENWLKECWTTIRLSVSNIRPVTRDELTETKAEHEEADAKGGDFLSQMEMPDHRHLHEHRPAALT